MGTNSFPKADVLAMCSKYGPKMHLSVSLDGRRVMAALASNESSLGANCGPRHEPAYDLGGSLASGHDQSLLLKEYGTAAACSYGPWQMMFVNFISCSPDKLLLDVELCADQFVWFFNRYVIGVRHAVTLEEIGQVWNDGHITSTPSPGVAAYCSHLQQAYDSLEF